MRTYRGVEVWLHSFLTSVPDGADWLIHDLADSPVANNLGDHGLGDWVGPRALKDVKGERKTVFSYHDSNPGPSSQ